ncbi:hypothetical protein GPK90_17010 [Clostridium sp. MCC344]|nr:YDG domain-containing protein [Clostridium sp. MCC344]MBT9790993.1 hypothetical protein [Clostridium sp. MCC344]
MRYNFRRWMAGLLTAVMVGSTIISPVYAESAMIRPDTDFEVYTASDAVKEKATQSDTVRKPQRAKKDELSKLKASDSNALLRTLSVAEEYDLKNGEVIIDKNGDYTISGTYKKMTGTAHITDHVITVKKDVSATITLKGVSIKTANGDTVKMSCIELEKGADVTLVLSGMNNLYTVSNSGAAIHVPKGSSLTIRAGTDKDVLYSVARAYGAGIGGNSGEGHGKITIESGTVAACSGMRLTDKGLERGTESDSGAGIGSGSAGIGGDMITIAGGSVYAAASVGAGIGGGYKGTSGTVVISGGDVEARGGEYNRSVNAVAIGPEMVDGKNNRFTLKASEKEKATAEFRGVDQTKTYTVDIGKEQTINYPGSRVVIKYGEQTRNGKLTVTPKEGVTYSGSGRVEIAGTGPYTVTMADSGTATREFIKIKSSCTVTLKQLNIYPKAQKVPAIDIDAGLEKVTLKLEGSNILKGAELAAAIDNHGTPLEITGSGSLDATAGSGSAAIGGSCYVNSVPVGKNITISGGDLTLRSNGDGTCLGAGAAGSASTGSADNLVISGGNVNLIKSGGGYCIGSTDLSLSSKPNIRITGGNVTATVSGDTGKICQSPITIAPENEKTATLYTGNSAPGSAALGLRGEGKYEPASETYMRVKFGTPHNLTVTGGTIVSTESKFAEGEKVPVSASAEIADGDGGTLYFAGWTVKKGSGTFADPLSSGTTFTMSDVDTEIKANYTGGYSVTVADGTITPGRENYAPGSTVTITAKDKSSEKLCFDRWEITNGNGEFLNGTARQKTAQLKVNSSLSVKAVYVSGHSLTVNNGTGSGAYRTGDVIEITAFLPAGSEFSSWTLDSGSGTFENFYSSTTRFTIGSEDAVVTAQYKGEGLTGDFIVSGGILGTDYKYENETLTITGSGRYEISLKEGIETTGNQITVQGGTPVITLHSVKVNGNKALRIENKAKVTLILDGENSMCSKQSNCVYVQDNSHLTITSIQGDGSSAGTLRAESGVINHAGIRGGSITVKGGTVIAKGEYGAAGIGGNAWGKIDNFSISIEGGTVEASGGWGGAGIGSANRIGGNVNINISGGTVKAVGGQGSAGIGIGYESGAKSRITITGGRTEGKGGDRYAGENTTSGVGTGSKYDNVEFDINERALIMHGLRSANEKVTAEEINQKTTRMGRCAVIYFPTDESGEDASISLTPETEVMYPGSSKQFTAAVKEAKDPTVDWRVSGNTSSDTKISSLGILTVGADEKAEALSVTASLRSYNKTASAEVTVNQIQTGLAVGSKEIEIGNSVLAVMTVPKGMSGQIRFYVDKAAVGSPITSTGGETSFTIGKELLPLGTHEIYAEYYGNGFRVKSGQISVTVKKRNPQIVSWPEAKMEIHYGQQAYYAGLQGGEYGAIPGDFAFDVAWPEVGTDEALCHFTPRPEYRDTYETIYHKVKIKVLPATPKVEENPAVNIQYGQSLKDAVISGGKVINPNYVLGQKQMIVDGKWSFKDPESVLHPGGVSCTVVFTPEDTKNYTGAIEKEVSVTVLASKPDLTVELDRETQVAGKKITVSAKAKNAFSPALEDVPEIQISYQIGNGAEQTASGNEIQIPIGTAVGTLIKITAKTAAVDGRYIETSETRTVTVADKTIVDKQISVTVPDVEYGSSPVPEGTFAGNVDGDESWAYTYSVDGGNTWSTEAPKTVGSYLVKAFYEDDSQKGENISSWNIIPKTVIVEGVVLEKKIYDGRTDVNVRSVSFGGLANGDTLESKDYSAAAKFKDANAGTDKKAFVEVSLSDTENAKNYVLDQAGKFILDGQSIKKAEAPSVPEISEAYSYGISGEQEIVLSGFPEDCGEISDGNADIISDKSGILEEKIAVEGTQLKFALKKNDRSQIGASAVIRVSGILTENYKIPDIQVVISLNDKNEQHPIAGTITFQLNGDEKTFTAEIGAVEGAEYSFDGTTWSDNNRKDDCQPDTLYHGWIRLKETETENAGPAAKVSGRTPKLAEKPPVVGPEKPGDGGNTGGDNGTKPGDGGNAGEDNGTKPGDGGNSEENNGSRPGSGTGSSSSDSSKPEISERKPDISRDSKKGYIDPVKGIIPGAANKAVNDGHSHWMKDKNGWWLRYSDGSYAAGKMIVGEHDNMQTVEHQWELINGSWYAFDDQGYLRVGLVYDAGYRGWFYMDENSGMQTGWVLINERWYFFNPVSDGTRGMMFIGRKTPDEYFVTEDGSWDGKTK